jgi:hypothetical protein
MDIRSNNEYICGKDTANRIAILSRLYVVATTSLCCRNMISVRFPALVVVCFTLILRGLVVVVAFVPTTTQRVNHRPSIQQQGTRSAVHPFSGLSALASPYLSAERVYFDIQIAGNDVGRLIFQLTIPSPLPVHAENMIRLCRGDLRGIDPAAHYVGCQFDYSPDYIEEVGINSSRGRYRWSHVLRGRNRNAIGRADQPIVDPENQLQCTHSVYGGQYYGDKYYDDGDDDPGVLLTVQVAGPGRGSSRLQIVRVGESPREWGERLLLNTGVIGRLVQGLETLHAMARQRSGPPTVVAAGVLLEDDE